MHYYIGIAVFTILAAAIQCRVMTTPEPVLCNVTLHPDSGGCPSGHCCVHDTFLFTYTHCKPHGQVHEPCSVRPSAFECHCADGLACISNIHGPHESLFGKCQRSGDTTPNVPVG